MGKMKFRQIDMQTYPRKDHFDHFLNMENPFVSLTLQVDITDWFHRIKKAGYPFFLSFQYAVVRAANCIPEFRQRIRDGGIVEYEFCNPSYTVSLPDGTYRYCLVNADQPLEEYLEEGKQKQEKALASRHLEEEGDVESLLFISCVPWLNYSACVMPFPHTRFSIPSFTWGKYQTEKYLVLEGGSAVEKEKITIPVTVLVHHALVDGIHIGTFFSNLNDELSRMEG